MATTVQRVEAEPGPPPGSGAALGHVTGIDGARAVAAMAVFIVHVTLLSGYVFRSPLGPLMARADIGVEIFFLISGFLLYRPFVADRFAGKPAADLGAYARRRLLRIFPAYWVALTIIAFVLRAPPFPDGHSVVAHYLLLQIYDQGQVSQGPIQQSWTLATELAFYAFLPCWAWLLSRRTRRPARQLRVELFALAGMWTAAMALKGVLLLMDLPLGRLGWISTWLPLRLDQFALGMTLAVLSAWVAHRGIRLPDWFRGTPGALLFWGLAAGAFVWVSFGFGLPLDLDITDRQFVFTRTAFSFIALAFLVPIVFGRTDRGLVRATLGNRAVVWVGLISYGIYLWHEAWMFLWLRITGQPELGAAFLPMFVFSLALSIVAGAASWYLIERPTMAWGRRLGRAPRVTAPAVPAAPEAPAGPGRVPDRP